MLNCFQAHAIVIYDTGTQTGLFDIVGMRDNRLPAFADIDAHELDACVGGGWMNGNTDEAAGVKTDPIKIDDILNSGLHRLIAIHRHS